MQVGKEHEDALQRIELLGQIEMAAGMAQQSHYQQGWQGTEQPAMRHIITWQKNAGVRLIQLVQRRRHTF